MNTKKRDTFCTCREILQTASDRCRLAEFHLRERTSEVNEPYSGMLEEVANVEQGLADDLERTAEEGSEEVLSSLVQFTSRPGTPKPAPRTVGDALKLLVAINEEVSCMLSGQAEKSHAAQVREAFDRLQVKVDAVGRKISLIRKSAEDV